MSTSLNDPMGQAILDFASSGKSKDIIVSSDICEDDVIPSEYLFRSFDQMPAIEKMALNHCSGNVLDVGAGAGVHAKQLAKQGLSVECIDVSPRSVKHLKSIGLNARELNFFDLEEKKYDTLLFLMNGLGIAGRLSNLERTLLHAKSLLSKNGKIICDSSDIKYLYEDEEGGMWTDLNSTYYGNFKFQMKYGDHNSDWFEWLYVDYDKLKTTAEKLGFNVILLLNDDDHYLVELNILNA